MWNAKISNRALNRLESNLILLQRLQADILAHLSWHPRERRMKGQITRLVKTTLLLLIIFAGLKFRNLHDVIIIRSIFLKEY